MRVVAASALAAATLSAVGVPAAAAVTPAKAVTPEHSTAGYTENFEHRVEAAPVPLTTYRGQGSQTYTAGPCPGDVLEFNASLVARRICVATPSATRTPGSESAARQLAFALGALAGVASPNSNHALVVSQTKNSAIELQTVKAIRLVASHRSLVLRVDTAAMNCTESAPQYHFYLTSGSMQTPIGGLIDPCSSGTAVTVPAVGSNPKARVKVETYSSPSVLTGTSSFGLKLARVAGTGAGIDVAFDNIRVLDVTPELDVRSATVPTLTKQSPGVTGFGFGSKPPRPARLNPKSPRTIKVGTTAAPPLVDCSTNSNIFNTGYDAATGGILPNNAKDANWQVAGPFPVTVPVAAVSPPPIAAVWAAANVGNLAPGAWSPSPFLNAQWITQQTIALPNSPAGDWYYRFLFTLDPAVDTARFVLDINFMADNAAMEAWVNGVAQSTQTTGIPQNVSNPYNYQGYHIANQAQTTFNHNWVTGLNTLVLQIKSGPPDEGFLAQIRPSVLCSVPLTFSKALGGPRVRPGDQFTMAIRTGSAVGPIWNSTTNSTTAGSGSTVTAGSGTTGVFPANPGTTYFLTEAAAGTGRLANYAGTITCTDPNGVQPGLPNGAAYPGSFTLTPVTGSAISCTVTNTADLVVDLTVAKSASPNPFVPGAVLTYTISVTNPGPSDAIGASVTDTLPASLSGAGFMWTCVASAGSSCSASGPAPGNIADTVTVTAGGLLTYTVSGTVPSGTTGTLANTVTAAPAAGTSDPNCAAHCSVTNNNPSGPVVDLTVAKSASPDPFVPGAVLTYTVSVTNAGPSDAIGASVTDTLPAALAGAGFTWACVASAGSSCTASGVGDIADTVTVAAAGSLIYTVSGTVPSGTTGTLDNMVTAAPAAGTSDPNCATNCSVTNHDPAGPVADLTVAKSASPDPFVPGAVLTYTISVTNPGPSDAIGASVTDTLPAALAGAGFTWTCVASAGSSCTATGPAPGNIADTVTVVAGGTLTYTVSGTVPSGTAGSLDNTVTAAPASGTADPNCAAHCSVTNHDPTSHPTVSIVKAAMVTPAADASAVNVGDSIVYSYFVTNTGNVTLATVTVTDATIGAVNCPVPTAPGLAPGGSETCTAGTAHKVTQADVDAGRVVDTATATGTDTHGFTGPPSPPSTVTTATVAPAPSVSLVKTGAVSPAADQSAARLGDKITYSFTVTNTGNVTLMSVAVSDLTGGAVNCPVPASPGLAPGTSETCIGIAAHTVTAADVRAGKVTDIATATGTDTKGVRSAPSVPATSVLATMVTPTLVAVTAADGLGAITTDLGQSRPGGARGAAETTGALTLIVLGGLGLARSRRQRYFRTPAVLAAILVVASAVAATVVVSGNTTGHRSANVPSPRHVAIVRKLALGPADAATPPMAPLVSEIGASGASLVIPALHIHAPLLPAGAVGSSQTASLTIPADVHTVAWWDGSVTDGVRTFHEGAPKPGQPGVAIIAGHIDSATAGPGALFFLKDAKVGDAIEIVDSKGQTSTWTVSAAPQTALKTELPASLWVTSGPPRLALVTCGGPFDAATGHYLDNIIVWASLATS